MGAKNLMGAPSRPAASPDRRSTAAAASATGEAFICAFALGQVKDLQGRWLNIPNKGEMLTADRAETYGEDDDDEDVADEDEVCFEGDDDDEVDKKNQSGRDEMPPMADDVPAARAQAGRAHACPGRHQRRDGGGSRR